VLFSSLDILGIKSLILLVPVAGIEPATY